MACGYVHRKQPMFLFTIAKSSSQMHGVSNRLNAASPRARWLGMIGSMTISELTDKKESQLTFTDETMQIPEAKWYRKLIQVNDELGPYESLRKGNRDEIATIVKQKNIPMRLKNQPPAKKESPMPKAGVPSGIRIVELDSDEDDDLVPYAKPDSDSEDEDEDPTLIQRNKPKAPV